MSVTETLTVSDLIEDTLEKLYRTGERPRVVTMQGGSVLSDSGQTQFTVAAQDQDLLNVTDVVEFGQELVLITAKSADATPVFTCIRGYSNTTPGAYPTGTVGLKNPQWGRRQVRRSLDRYFDRAGNLWLPFITSGVFNPTTDKYYVELPSTTMRVLEVTYMHPTTGRLVYIDNWNFFERVPTGVVTSTKVLRTPSVVDSTDDLMVTYQESYSYTSTDVDDDEADTVEVPVGSQDLASQYACAYLLAGRELSRSEVDHVEEWNQEQVQRAGVNLRLLRDLWGQFYRAVDESRRLHHVPRHRPYRKIRHV